MAHGRRYGVANHGLHKYEIQDLKEGRVIHVLESKTEAEAVALDMESHRTGLAPYQIDPNASATVLLFAAAMSNGTTEEQGREYGRYVDQVEDLSDGVQAMPFYTWLQMTKRAEAEAETTRKAYAELDN